MLTFDIYQYCIGNIQQFLQSFHFKMPFNATVDIFVNFSYVQVRFLNRQGYLCYRMKIFHKESQSEITNCRPYNIMRSLKKNQEIQSTPLQQSLKQSEIDHEQEYYYSRIIPVRYRPADYHQNQTVFFKAYINIDKIDQIKFQCQIQCLFGEQKDGHFQVVGTFNGKIHHIYNISTFLPVSFDAFQGFNICSTFHGTIMEFKFHNEQAKTQIKSSKSLNKIPIEKQTYDFWSYVDTITNRFNRDSLMKFYLYYRNFLIKQLQTLENRYNTLLKSVKRPLKAKKTLQRKNLILQKLIADKAFGSHCIVLTSTQQDIIRRIQNDFADLKGQIYQKWIQFANFVSENSTEISHIYRLQYQNLSRDRFKNNVFSHRISGSNWLYSKYNDSGKIALEKAFVIKKKSISDQEMWIEHFPIEKLEHFGKKETNIKIFEQIYQTDCLKIKDNLASRHIIVLVHGFQAYRQDLYLFKNCLQVNYGIQVIISTCNEGSTDNSILVAGRRLAMELKKMLAGFKGDFRLSFIGHSMGGLIIRAAIPQLQCFKDKFYTYMSLSTPHLGYLYQSSTLVRAGLWLFNTIQKCDSLLQMAMSDKQDISKTTLYKLSSNNGLKNFKKICFVCSSQDQYVVYQSARIQLNQTLIQKSMKKQTKKIVKQMVSNILSNVSATQISRINVVFNIQDKNLDSFLGRTGHIKFLSDLQFIREFCSCFDKFFI